MTERLNWTELSLSWWFSWNVICSWSIQTGWSGENGWREAASVGSWEATVVLSSRKRVQGQYTPHASRLEDADRSEPGRQIYADTVTAYGFWHIILPAHLQERYEGGLQTRKWKMKWMSGKHEGARSFTKSSLKKPRLEGSLASRCVCSPEANRDCGVNWIENLNRFEP